MISHLACHCYLCRDGCVNVALLWNVLSFVYLVSQCLHIHPAIPTFGKFLLDLFLNSYLCSVLLYTTAHALVVDASSSSKCTDKWRPTANTLCPHNQKALEFCRSYTQNKAQKHHPQGIPWLLVAVLNATLIVLQH